MDIDRLNLKFIQKCKEPKIALLKRIKLENLYHQNSRPATVIKTVECWYKDRQIDQWNKTVQKNTPTYKVTWFMTKVSLQFSREIIVFFIKWCFDNCIFLWEKTISPTSRQTQKWMIYLNVKAKKNKALKENIRE